jgi:hypothetical protein
MCLASRSSQFSAFTIWVKRPPKPGPVNRRPPAVRRFYFPEVAVPLRLSPQSAIRVVTGNTGVRLNEHDIKGMVMAMMGNEVGVAVTI